MESSKFVDIERQLLISKAYRELTGTAAKCFMWFSLKCDPHKIDEKMKFSYGEARAQYGLREKRFSRAIDELVDKGFLDVVRVGKMGGPKAFTLYKWSDRWRFYGTMDFAQEA